MKSNDRDPSVIGLKYGKLRTAAIGAIAGLALVGSAEKAQAATPPKAVSKGLDIVKHLGKGDRPRVLSGETSALVIGKGVKAYKLHGKETLAFRLPFAVEAMHANYTQREHIGAISFKLGQDVVSLQMNAQNEKKLHEIDENGKRHQFDCRDITTQRVTVDRMLYGFAFTSHGAQTDWLAGEVNGRPEVPVAQAASS